MTSKKEKALKSANRFLQKGQVDKAIREYEKILSFDARDPRIRHKYAELLARKGRREDALEEFRWVADYYQQGGFYPKAIAILKQMLGLDSDSIEVHLQLGQIYHSQRKVSDATIHFQKAAALVDQAGTLQQKLEVHERLYMLSPNDLDAAWRLVSMYTGAAQPQKAMELLTRMAERLRTEGDLNKLLSVLDRLAGIASEPTAYLKEMAYVLLQRGNPKSAISKLQLCFKKDPQDTETLDLLGRAFEEQGERDKALQVLEELGRIYAAAGDGRQAAVEERIRALRPQEQVVEEDELPAAEAVVEAPPLELPEQPGDDALWHLVRGDVFLRYGLVDRAKVEGNEAVQGWPELFASHQLRARSLVRLARPEDAADSYLQMYTIAMDRGVLPVARRCLVRTIELLPGDGGALSRLEAFDDAMGPELANWSDDTLAPGGGVLESGIATESAGNFLLDDDAADVLAALEGIGSGMLDEPDRGGRSSMLRDEIDVDIAEMFTRTADGPVSVGEVAVGTPSMDDEFEELDQASYESLPADLGMSDGDPPRPSVWVEQGAPGEGSRDEVVEEEEDTAQDPDAPDLSGLEQGAEELLDVDPEERADSTGDDFLAVEIPDILDIRPTHEPADEPSEDTPTAEYEEAQPPPPPPPPPPRPPEVAEQPELDIELEREPDGGDADDEQEPAARAAAGAREEIPDDVLELAVQPEVVLDSDAELVAPVDEPSEDVEDELALEPNPVGEGDDSSSGDLDDDLLLEPRTEPPTAAEPVEPAEQPAAPRADTGQDDISFGEDEPTSDEEDELQFEEEPTPQEAVPGRGEGDLGLALVLERSMVDDDEDFDDLLADMAEAIEDDVDPGDIGAGEQGDGTDPDMDEIDLALGYYEVGLFDEALREFQSAFDAGVDPPRALLYIGRCYRELKSLDEAAANLQRGLEDIESGDPLYLDLMYELGLTYEDQRQPGLARGMYEQILEVDDSYRGGEAAKRFMALADT